MRTKTSLDFYVGPNPQYQYHDKHGDELYLAAFSTLDVTERNRLLKELNTYILENVMFVGVQVMPPLYNATQPWVRGYHGEIYLRYASNGGTVSRAWLDQEMR